jgi:hypothetical protein
VIRMDTIGFEESESPTASAAALDAQLLDRLVDRSGPRGCSWPVRTGCWRS